MEAKLSSRGSTSVASMYQTLSYVSKLLFRGSAQCCSLPFEETSYSLPSEETGYSLPPEGTSYSLPPKGASYSLPLEGTSCSLHPEGTSYSLVIASGPEVAFVTPAIPVDRSNMEWFCLKNIRS
ncbi:hypothetical protein Tco_1119137 [Tanacetum coccineum]